VKNNGAQSYYILNKKYEYGPIYTTMCLFNIVKRGPLPMPFEQFYMQSHYQHNIMVAEQYEGVLIGP